MPLPAIACLRFPNAFLQTHMDANGRDLDWTKAGWMASRCPGVDERGQVWAELTG